MEQFIAKVLLKLLTLFSDENTLRVNARSAALPNVPTIAESGAPGFDVVNWTAMFAPAGTPAAVVAKLSAEVLLVMKLPEIQARMVDEGMRTTPMTPKQFGEFVQAEVKRWGDVVRRIGVTAE